MKSQIIFISFLFLFFASCDETENLIDVDGVQCESYTTGETINVACRCTGQPEGWGVYSTEGCYYQDTTPETCPDGQTLVNGNCQLITQPQPDVLIPIISASCSANESVKHVYYERMIDAHTNYFVDIQDLVTIPGTTSGKPYWDIRYVNPITKYMDGGDYSYFANHGEFTGLDTRTGIDNLAFGTYASTGDSSGSIAQAECIGGAITAGTTINLYDTPGQELLYSGPQTTFAYRLGSAPQTSPWNADGTGNLMIQAFFDRPLYADYGGNYGGGVNIGFFLKNKITDKHINFVISAYGIGEDFSSAKLNESREILFDPTTQVVHVDTVFKDGTIYSTKSQYSRTTELVTSDHDKRTSDDGKWENFFRVNVSYQNLMSVLQKSQEQGWAYDLHPEDWEVTSMMIQFELEEEGGGKAILSGSFQSFEVYSTINPM